MTQTNRSSDSETPKVAVIVPVYEDPDGIRTTLESLLAQSCEWPHRIVVVDNGSTDDTPNIVRSYDDNRLTLLFETDIQSSYAARNTGVNATESDILAFVDADMAVPDGWLRESLRELEAANADYMGCNVDLTLPNSPTIAGRYDHHTGFPVEGYLERQQFVPTCCLFVRRAVFADVGLFDRRLMSGGDKEFGNRVHGAGYDSHLADDITVSHPTRSSIGELIAKDIRVGRGLCQLQRYHPDRYGTPGIPPRPTGIKRPDQDLSRRDRVAFGALSRFLTGVRGAGYYREFVAGDCSDDPGTIPELDT
ncbi:glycosyltransferase [Halorubrum aquaticum]|uniref:glycosyltransferase n=1 Tax=Halorubrum aquaticum TaxID=387340 RepID=UPI00122C4F44|nr:glycosyltransferase [Halorubrum aquaticum]